LDQESTATNSPSDPVHWSPLTRFAFRFVFAYFMLYAFCCGNATLWELIPFHAGEHLEDWFNWPFNHAGQWLAQHLFHVQGVGAKIHGGGSGDKAIDWISCGVMFVTAVVLTLVWSALDRRRTHYRNLFGWMRFLLRLALGYAMLNYGFAKLFPLQMMPPSLAVLNEPLGNSSPMTLLWTLIGLNPVYEMVCGATEVLAGTLILFRRTALAGALFTAFVVSNVVLYNYFFDVPVKIYATHLLLMALVVIAPDMQSLIDYFLLHKPSVPTGNWMLPANRRNLRIETIIIAVVLVLSVGLTAADLSKPILEQRASVKHPGPLTGQWHVDSAAPKPFLTGGGLPMTDIFFELSGRMMIRASDQQLWRAGNHYDEAKHTLMIATGNGRIVYSVQQPDPMHMILTPTGNDAKTASTLSLTRIPLPSHYPIEDRGFHFVNEWGLER
jgi:hypothetical protein